MKSIKIPQQLKKGLIEEEVKSNIESSRNAGIAIFLV